MFAPTKSKTMGRPKKGTDGNPPTASVKIDRQLAGRARIVATEMKIDLSVYLSELIRGQVNRDWQKIVKGMDEQGQV